MYGTYSFWRFHTELRPSEVDPRFNFFFYKKYTVTKNPTATIFEWEVPQRIASFETHFFRTLFVVGPLTRKLWPWDFLLRFPIFAGRSRFAALSRLRTGITRTKKIYFLFNIEIVGKSPANTNIFYDIFQVTLNIFYYKLIYMANAIIRLSGILKSIIVIFSFR